VVKIGPNYESIIKYLLTFDIPISVTYSIKISFSRFIETKKMKGKREVEKIAMDFDDILVQSVDGLITGGDSDEIKLLFYYIKPESYIDEDGTIEGKGVAELRVSCSKFMDIAKEVDIKVKEIQKGRNVMVMFG